MPLTFLHVLCTAYCVLLVLHILFTIYLLLPSTGPNTTMLYCSVLMIANTVNDMTDAYKRLQRQTDHDDDDDDDDDNAGDGDGGGHGKGRKVKGKADKSTNVNFDDRSPLRWKRK